MKRIILFLVAVFSAFQLLAAAKGNLTVGVLSDVHARDDASKETFVKALQYFRDADVDAVMIAGDMIECGMECELVEFSKLWYSVFPKDKGLKGKKVERLFIYGNHEINGHTFKNAAKKYSPEEREAGCIASRREQVWKRCFKEEFQPIYIKKVGGYVFIGAHFQNVNQADGLEDFFAEHAADIPSDKPFFYFQHTHPKGTCSGDKVWGQDNGASTVLLSNYPNVISFSGHSHTTLTDEKTIWQGAFTSVGTASLNYINFVGTDHENGKLPKGKVSQMYRLNGHDGHQGMLMTVYDDRVELLRHEFKNDEDLGTWCIPLGSDKPYSFEKRELSESAPEFAAGAKIKIVDKPEGKNNKKEIVHQKWVRFPAIAAVDGRPRAFDFQVDVETLDGDSATVVLSKKVFSRGAYLGENADAAQGAYCVFAVSELPVGVPYRYAVRPMNCFGKKGNPIYSKTISE